MLISRSQNIRNNAYCHRITPFTRNIIYTPMHRSKMTALQHLLNHPCWRIMPVIQPNICNFLNNPNKVNGQFEKAIRIYKDVISRHPYHIFAWHCIMECYKGLTDEKQAKQTETHLRKLIQTDKRAADMFVKYGNMIKNWRRDYHLR